jgi:hypothetical protein
VLLPELCSSRARPRAPPSRGQLDAPQEDILTEPRRQLVGGYELPVWPAVGGAVSGCTGRQAPLLEAR